MPTILKIDDIHKLYDYTDRIIKFLAKKNIWVFEESVGCLRFANNQKVISYCRDMYNELEEIAILYYVKLANHILEKYGGKDVDRKWVEAYLKDYNPVTKYSFMNEVDRKRGRFEESILASTERIDESNKGLRDWGRMVNQYAIGITDAALIKSYKDNNVKFVKWKAVHDNRCCGECDDNDGKVFAIDEIPPKPHWGCRCILIAYDGRNNQSN